MKEVTAAVRALRQRAEALLTVAKALTHLDSFAKSNGVKHKRTNKRHISRAGRQRIRVAQQKRWAAFRKQRKAV
jgi:hypothetical protein